MLKKLHAEFDPKLPLGNLIGSLVRDRGGEASDPADDCLRASGGAVAAGEEKEGRSVDRGAVRVVHRGMELANAYSELNDPVDQRDGSSRSSKRGISETRKRT